MFKYHDYILFSYNLGYLIPTSTSCTGKNFDINKNFRLYYFIIYLAHNNIDYNWSL